MKYHDNATVASNAIGLRLNLRKLKFLMPEIFSPIRRIKYWLRKLGSTSHIERISEHIQFGASQGAIVVNIAPLLVAAYNEDIDCVVVLKFETRIQARYRFKKGDRLVVVNTFGKAEELQHDLIPGARNSGMWSTVHPVIAELVSGDTDLIDQRKKQIGDKGYEYIQKLADEYVIKKPNTHRNGKPFYAFLPGNVSSAQV